MTSLHWGLTAYFGALYAVAGIDGSVGVLMFGGVMVFIWTLLNFIWNCTQLIKGQRYR